MKNHFSLPEDKKLTLVIRIEAGCLGPNGDEHIEEFCKLVQVEVEPDYSEFVRCELIPRYDKMLPEVQYKTINKILDREKASKYLGVFGKSLDELEYHIQEILAVLIDQYLGH